LYWYGCPISAAPFAAEVGIFVAVIKKYQERTTRPRVVIPPRERSEQEESAPYLLTDE
jgi:hypothetical protein